MSEMITGNSIRIYQLFVLESSYKIKRITLQHYIEMSLDLMKKYGATHELVALLFSHIQSNRNRKFIKENILSKESFSEILNSMLETNIFDKEGNILVDLTTDFWQSMSEFKGE